MSAMAATGGVRVQKSGTTLKELREENSTRTASKLSSQPRGHSKVRTQGLLGFIEQCAHPMKSPPRQSARRAAHHVSEMR
jgi:hypothetical protein